MKTAIVQNKNIPKNSDVIKKIIEEFDKNGIEYEFPDIEDKCRPLEMYDFVCAAGGDGTILKAACCFAKTAAPVLGINLGRLGFLSSFSPDELSGLAKMILNKDYEINERIMLSSSDYTALNDFVIKGHSSIRAVEFSLFIDDKFVCGYIADGLIVSTPTGSTAYGLSAGGPILYPDLDVFVIVPICAHTMTARPLVVPASSNISVKSGGEYLDVSCDGRQMIFEIKNVKITLSPYRAKLAFPRSSNFYSRLKNKLYWGISPAL